MSHVLSNLFGEFLCRILSSFCCFPSYGRKTSQPRNGRTISQHRNNEMRPSTSKDSQNVLHTEKEQNIRSDAALGNFTSSCKDLDTMENNSNKTTIDDRARSKAFR